MVIKLLDARSRFFSNFFRCFNSLKHFIISSLIVIILDQASKQAVRSVFSLGESYQITSFFSFSYIANTGAGFGLFTGRNNLFIVISSIIILGIIFYASSEARSMRSGSSHLLAYLGMICGGAVSNLLDRIFLGYVTDFIHFSFWPAFNIADSAITAGVFLIILHDLRKEK